MMGFRHSFPWKHFLRISYFLVISFGFYAHAWGVTLTWDPVVDNPDLAGYTLYYKTGASGPPYNGAGADQGISGIEISLQSLADVDHPQITLTGLTENITYYFVVTSYDSSGLESGYSNEAPHEIGAENTAPTVAITSPAHGVTVSEDDGPFLLTGTASDPEDGDLGNSIQWTSSLDGAVASPAALSPGTHTLVASVTDSGGASGSDVIMLTVTAHANTAPTVAISSPADNTSLSEDDGPIPLTGTASDPEDGDLGASIQWTSSLDGPITSPATLSVGEHTISASVDDLSGASGSASVAITVTAGGAAGASVTLAWDPAAGYADLAGYRVYYKTGSSGPPYNGTGAHQGASGFETPLPNFADANNPQLTLTGLVENTTYYFVVAAYGVSGWESEYSNETAHVAGGGNTAPAVDITSPADNSAASQSDGPFALAGTASDPEDGDLGASIQWTSSLDGAIASPAALSVGAHTITARVTDSGGLSGDDAITFTVTASVNAPPIVVISSPADNITISEDDGPIALTGTASDPEDGDVTANIQWSSSLDGPITSPAALSPGAHAITASVTDSGGSSGSAAVALTVTAHVNAAPIVAVTSPSDNAAVLEGDGPFALTSVASDPEDGDLGGSIQWTSSIDGAIASPAALSPGRHTITASAADSASASGSASITFTVYAAGAAAVTLSWDPISDHPDLAGYKIYYKIGSSGAPYNGTGADQGASGFETPLQSLADAANPRFTLTGLAENTTYYFVVAAYDDPGAESDYSNEVVHETGAGNTSPTVVVASPADNAAASEDDGPFALTGTASDAEDGDLGESIQWTSSLDGAVSSPAVLSVGTHTITASVTDSGGLTHTAAVTFTVTPHLNAPPAVSISSPANNAIVSEDDSPVALVGSASDPEEGDVSGSIQWTSNLDGAIASPATLSVGTHTITAGATDDEGLTGSAAITLTVTAHVNEPPIAAISSPVDNATVSEDDGPVALIGSASDTEDGDVSASLQWTSSLDGVLTSPTTLTPGEHTITASATDGDGSSGSASITLTVTAHVNEPPTAAISS
ncbi:MAG: fibronectin type III domain-containing protein, partial [Desulfobacterales bacterium]|nr:fibronectin type III domain-containing protein [Desulfobacterales bacterium]